MELAHLAEGAFVKFPYCKVTLSPPLSIAYSLEGSHYGQPEFVELEEISSTAWSGEYLHKFFYIGRFVYSPFIYLNQYILVDVYFML